MPVTRDFARTRDGVQLRYELRGNGEPLALIMGFSGSMRGWGEEFVNLLEPHFKLVLIDNRGTGESDKPDKSWTMDDMASDIAAVLDHAKLPRTHVFGISMGGMIAQMYALTFPSRVRGLVLGCTNCGATNSVPAKPEDLARLMPQPGASPIQQAEVAMSVVLSPKFLGSDRGKQFISQMVAQFGTYPMTPMQTFAHQAGAIGGFNSFERLGEIKARTLIMHGDDDLIVPFPNAAILQGKIANSKSVTVSGAGHMFWIEEPAKVAGDIREFLSAVR